MKDRGIRRAQEKRVKVRVKNIISEWYIPSLESKPEPSKKDVGRAASVHMKGCSCSMCGNPRRTYRGKGALTMQELRKLQVEE
jgi:hypothetical protein